MALLGQHQVEEAYREASGRSIRHRPSRGMRCLQMDWTMKGGDILQAAPSEDLVWSSGCGPDDPVDEVLPPNLDRPPQDDC